MARPVTGSNRIDLRLKSEDKSVLARAAALANQDLTGFILGAAIPAARKTIERSEQLQLSERDSLKVIEMLENPPRANARLRAAKTRLSHSRRSG